MKYKKQQGHVVVEYLVVAAAIFIAWSFVGVFKDGISNHQEEYTWSISQPNI